MPIATGHELEELAAEVQVTFRNLYLVSDAIAISEPNEYSITLIYILLLSQGKNILEIDHPEGPFGTKVSVI